MRTLRSAFLVCLATMFAAPQASAQFELFTDLYKNFSDLAIQWGEFTPKLDQIRPESDPKKRWLGSYGAEFIFELASVSTAEARGSKNDACTAVRIATPKERQLIHVHRLPDSLDVYVLDPKCKEAGACGAVRADAPKERQVIYRRGVTDSVDVYLVESKCKKPAPDILLELGVGFFQTSRFRIKDGIGSMTGVFRETPAISVYASWLRGDDISFRPYGAIRAGVTDLVSPSLEDSLGVNFPATSPKSVEVGGVVGLSKKLHRVFPGNVFAEFAYMYRPFSGITWGPNPDDKTKAAPRGTRKRLDFSGTSVMFGLQLTVKDPNKK